MDSQQPGSDECRTQVYRKDIIKIVYTCFGNGREFANACIIDNYIDITPNQEDTLHATLKRFLIAYVDLVKYGSGFFAQLLSCRFVLIAKCYAVTCIAKCLYDGFTYSFSSSGYEYPFFLFRDGWD